MVTRRAVLKGTAAASIGAIAAAHGATPLEAQYNLDVGFGQLEGGAIGGFQKYADAFQIAYKFHKGATEIFFKEQSDDSVAIFWKYFDKARWTEVLSKPVDGFSKYDLQGSDLYFSKIYTSGAELFIKNEVTKSQLFLKLNVTLDGLQLNYIAGSTDIIE